MSRRAISDTSSLFRLDVGRLDDGPPFLDFGPLKGAERLGRLLLARWNFLSEISKALAHCWIGQGVDHRSVELGDNLLGRVLGCPKSVPDRKMEACHPSSVRRRNSRRCSKSRLGCNGVSRNRSGAHLRQCNGCLRNIQVDMPAYQIVHCWRGTAIGHELETGGRKSVVEGKSG